MSIKILGEYVHATQADGESLVDCLRQLARRGDRDIASLLTSADDAANLRARLERAKAELADVADCCEQKAHVAAENATIRARLEQVGAERDRAVEICSAFQRAAADTLRELYAAQTSIGMTEHVGGTVHGAGHRLAAFAVGVAAERDELRRKLDAVGGASVCSKHMLKDRDPNCPLCFPLATVLREMVADLEAKVAEALSAAIELDIAGIDLRSVVVAFLDGEADADALRDGAKRTAKLASEALSKSGGAEAALKAARSEGERVGEERAADIAEAARDFLVIIDKADLLNLSSGVQLGPTSWYAKASDARELLVDALRNFGERARPSTKEEDGRGEDAE